MFEYDYLQAKLHGVHSKSFIGENYQKLKKIKSIEIIRKKILDEENSALLEKSIHSYIEKKFKERVFREINFVASYFDYENDFINNLILKYELDNVKLIIAAHYKKVKNISGLFEVSLKKSLNYEVVYNSDISEIKNIRKIFENTYFSFLTESIEEKKELIYIENALDRFYYENLIFALNKLNNYERNILKDVVFFEMNWQNITWAFRTKLFYKKSFDNIKETFLNFGGLIKADVLEKIFKIEFLPNEAEMLFKEYPSKYREVILSAFDEQGDFDLVLLESRVSEALFLMYTKYFFNENFNMLPIISFIFLKKQEYANIVKLIEGIRYNILSE